jgi:predicted ester cyclase
MSTDANKALARRFIKEVFEEGRPESVDALVTPDFVSHGLPGAGPDVMKQAITRVGKGLSDASMSIDDVVAEGDKVVVRLMSTATQSGEFMGMPATGKTYTIEELHEFRLADGRIAEHWHQGDMLGMLKQLGLMPDPSKK